MPGALVSATLAGRWMLVDDGLARWLSRRMSIGRMSWLVKTKRTRTSSYKSGEVISRDGQKVGGWEVTKASVSREEDSTRAGAVLNRAGVETQDRSKCVEKEGWLAVRTGQVL